jgi:hypothetical protein
MRITKSMGALEALYIPSVRVMSMEEEIVAVDQAATDASDIREAINNASRVLETSDAMTDLARTAERIERATPSDLNLIDRAAQLVVAGTDRDPSTIEPALEEYLGKRPVLEGFKEVAKQMYDFVLKMIANIKEKIASFFKIGATIPAQKQTMDATAKAAEEASEETLNKNGAAAFDDISKAEETPPIAKATSVNGKPMLAAADVIRNLDILRAAFKAAYAESSSSGGSNVKRVEAIHEAMRTFDPANPDAAIGKLNTALAAQKFVPMAGSATAVTDSEGYSIAQGPVLMSDCRLVVRQWLVRPDDDALVTLEHLRKSGITLQENEVSSTHAQVAKKPWTASDIQTIMKSSTNLLDAMGWMCDVVPPDTKAASDLLQKGVEEMTAKFNKVPEPSAEAQDAYRALMGCANDVARWFESPSIPLYRRSMNVLRNISIFSKQLMQGAPQPATKEA